MVHGYVMPSSMLGDGVWSSREIVDWNNYTRYTSATPRHGHKNKK
jgi:hypothetical protein